MLGIVVLLTVVYCEYIVPHALRLPSVGDHGSRAYAVGAVDVLGFTRQPSP